MKKIKIQIDKNNKLLGYCIFGDMPNSIEIETEENFEFKEDVQNYIFVDGKLEYSPCLEKLKKARIEEIKRIRDKKISEDLEVEGALFQVRTEDLQKFFLKKIEFDLGTATTDNWRLADNTYKEIDFEFIKKILEAYGTRQREMFTKFGMLEHQIKNCNTVEEINSIKWE